MKVKFWGVRGTIPVPGPDTVQVGGNTACVEVQTVNGEVVILDAGTGIRLLGLDLIHRNTDQLKAVVLFSHTHWDHIQGLPFFAPAMREHNHLRVLGERRVDGQLQQVLASHMSNAYLPFGLDDLDAQLEFEEIQDGEQIVTGAETAVAARRLPHPGGAFGYRIDCQGKVVAYATDVGHPAGGLDAGVLDLARGADLLIHDAQFTPREKQKYPHWGHSSWMEATQVAQEAGVQRLALFHHDPLRTDDELMEIEREAQLRFAGAFVAREGMEIEL